MKKKFWIILVVIVVLAAAAFLVAGKYSKKEKTAEVTREVRPEYGDISVSVSATGTVKPQNRLEIKPTISGRIEEVLVREGEHVAPGQRLALMSSTERATLLDAARLRDAATLAYWEEVYKPSPLLSPIEGTVISRDVEPGQTVTNSTTVLVLSDRLIVKAQVDETDIGAVKIGQDAFITLDAYPDKRIRGKIDHIAYESITVSNVTIYEVDILPGRVPEQFRAGMSANVEIVVASAENVLTLPAAAVRSGSDGKSYVLVPNPSGEPRRIPIERGIEAAGKIEIISGLEEQQPVLVSAGENRANRRSSAQTAGTNPLMPQPPGHGRTRR